jgi:hypothetical protein
MKLNAIGSSLLLPLLRPDCEWFVYMLINKNSTIPYIGKTNDLERRLRQHNGEISGGAKRTHRALNSKKIEGRGGEEGEGRGGEGEEGKWNRVLHVKGFIDERAALHFENRFQRERRKVSKHFANSIGPLKRKPLLKGLQALNAVMSCDRPTRAARLLAEYGVNVVFENDEAEAEYNNMNGLKNVLKIQK